MFSNICCNYGPDIVIAAVAAVITKVWTTNIQIKFKCNIFIMLGYKTEVNMYYQVHKYRYRNAEEHRL